MDEKPGHACSPGMAHVLFESKLYNPSVLTPQGVIFHIQAELWFSRGIVLPIPLVSKNRILIVEFARENCSADQGLFEATLDAARLRFRPILMTACSTLLGMVPLVIASGAGAASRRALGTAVFGGLVAATVLVVFFAPLLYVVMQRLSEWHRPIQDAVSPRR